MVRLFIEDIEMDVMADFSHQITYAVDDVKNLDTKSTSFSKTIVIPGTSKNNKLFGNIFEFGNSNFSTTQPYKNVYYDFNASKSAKARLDVNGLTIMKGVLRLMQIVIDNGRIEYEVALFGELGGFFSKLGASKLEDLDFSAYNHAYNVTNISASWDNFANGSGYFYPLIDYGNTSALASPFFAKKSFYFTAFRPALFVREYIDKIITGAGYTWESNFFNTTFFKKLIVPNNQLRLAYKKTQIFSGKPSSSVGIGDDVTITNQVGANFSTADNKTWTYNGTQTFNGAVNLKMSGTWRITNQQFIGSKTGRFNLYKNGSLFATDGTLFGVPPSQVGGFGNSTTNVPFNFTARYTPLLTPFSLATNDTFSIRFDNVSGPDAISVTITGVSITLDGTPTYTPANYGDTLAITDTIPKGVLQKDFFSSIVKMFYLMITEDKYKEKHLIIEPWIDFYDLNPANYLDWSAKVDRSKPIKIKPMSEINARYYTLKGKVDSDFYNDKYKKKWNENYGDRIYDNQQEFAKDSDGVEVIFAPTPLVGYTGTGHDKIFPAIYKFNNGAEEATEFIPRILFANKFTGKTSWKIYSNNTIIGIPQAYGTYTSYGYAGHYDNPNSPTYDLNFGATKELFFDASNGFGGGWGTGNNLFNLFYASYFAENTDKDSRLVTMTMKFYEKDIFNLNFGKVIYIDGILYRLIKITDYSDGELCQVDLMRIINLSYL
jgi:hypothetical protein